MMDKKQEFEEIIGYTFKDSELLENALTHSSFANEGKKTESNERLEFLGDSVLGLVVGEYLYKNAKKLHEGNMTKMRASLVCESSLCDFAREIRLGEFIQLGKGERKSGGDKRPSLLADAYEALIAAIYLDRGYNPARKFILKFVKQSLKQQENTRNKDYKTELQEIIQHNHEEMLRYVVTGEKGPAHDVTFEVELYLNTNLIAKGSGKSKKEAEQTAAREALKLMGVEKE